MSRLLFGIGILMLLLNLYFGWHLSQNQGNETSMHLAIGLSASMVLIAAVLVSLIESRKNLEKLALTGIAIDRLLSKRSKALFPSFGTLVVVVLSILSGLNSESGMVPWAHLILSIGLIILSSLSLIRWIQWFHEIPKA